MDHEAHVRRLWRHRGTTLPTPRRGPRQQLDLDDLLDAGIAIADESGLAAVSTRAIAGRFGKTPMALYPYVGTKEELLALMQDHACAMPVWTDPATTLAADLQSWSAALFDVYVAHPWLASRPWSQATQGPCEQDWLERLLRILARWQAPETPTVTMLYATIRACAETTASYLHMDHRGMTGWLAQAEETARQIPDYADRYPLSTSQQPVTSNWQDAPRAALTSAVDLLAKALLAN
ncbi:TetR/AcrR family transcriptional regulator [Winogradskya humida]|uniref:TetR family transcriptional regulator n=1 Tax=Winogradskya humida TaxID=113566 RepID=A0ABQ3ZFV8_9ACTN|nr:TetR family transcriptional regulator [Actinoplanes humidus]GIE17461.1 TetR family transcriptional regulator [Actinoplanes humidus]